MSKPVEQGEEIEVDRTHEQDEVDPTIYVTFPDGYEERFWLTGLSDEEYIRRAKILRERANERTK